MGDQKRSVVFVVIGVVLSVVFALILSGRIKLSTHAEAVVHREKVEAPAAISNFSAWLTDPQQTVAEGVDLARSRSVLMKELIGTDPEQALKYAVSLSDWTSLPEEVRDYVETPFSVLAPVEVLIHCGDENSKTSIVSDLPKVGKLETFAYGRRLEMLSKEKTPLQGIYLGAVAALRTDIFQSISGEDLEIAKKRYPLAQKRPGVSPVAALAGGYLFYFDSSEELKEANSRMGALNAYPGPESGAGQLFQRLENLVDENGNIDFQMLEEQALAASAEWTSTPRNMHFIQVDFPDMPGAPTDPVAFADMVNTVVSQQIWEMSYGKSHIVCTVDTNIYRLPLNNGVYTNNGALHTAARNAAGVDLNDYDTVCVGHKGPGGYAGLASVGGKKMWLKGFGSKVTTHELGHNYGARHASFWLVSGSNPVDPDGEKIEYGNFTDIMGGGGVPSGHFSPWHKRNINWFESANWKQVTSAGKYRVYRCDHHATSGQIKALEIDKGDGGAYWVGYKQNYGTTYENFNQGAHLGWKKPSDNRSYLVDATPESEDGKNDSGLAIGRTFSDKVGDVHITPVERGGQMPDEWLDVVVNLGTLVGNRPPVATLSGPTNANARSNLEFTISATDPDGDELAYAWDIGDGYIKSNSVALSYAQLAGGTIHVSCVVTDMKGGTATVSKDVAFSDPLQHWTKRISGTTEGLSDILVRGDEILVTGEQGGIYRSTNAIDWTHSDLGSNRQIFGVLHDGTQYVGVGVDYDFTGPGWEAAVFTSADGNSWVRRFDGGALGLGKLYDVAQGNGVLVAVGNDGALLRSTNGSDWSVVASGTTKTLKSVSFGDGVFVAVGNSSAALSSSDGLVWANNTDGVELSNKSLYSVDYCKDRFLLGGWRAGILHSTDQGESFVAGQTGGQQIIRASARGQGIYFSVGDDPDNSSSAVNLVSIDGLSWGSVSTPDQDHRTALAVYGGTFITVGDNGAIWQSVGIDLPDLGYTVWQLENTTALGADYGPLADADHDGSPNLVEYALGSSAFDGNDTPSSIASINPAGYLQMSVARKRRVSDINYDFQRALNLVYPNWDHTKTVVLEDSQTNLTVRSTVPMAQQSTEFLRLRIELK